MLRWTSNLAYAGLLAVLAVVPAGPFTDRLAVPDWFAHAGAYGFQAGLIYWALLPMVGMRLGLIGAIGGASIFGVATEALQLLQPGRSVEIKDVVANTLGAFIVAGMIFAVGSKTRRKAP
jgi:VanZ family protein